MNQNHQCHLKKLINIEEAKYAVTKRERINYIKNNSGMEISKNMTKNSLEVEMYTYPNK